MGHLREEGRNAVGVRHLWLLLNYRDSCTNMLVIITNRLLTVSIPSFADCNDNAMCDIFFKFAISAIVVFDLCLQIHYNENTVGHHRRRKGLGEPWRVRSTSL